MHLVGFITKIQHSIISTLQHRAVGCSRNRWFDSQQIAVTQYPDQLWGTHTAYHSMGNGGSFKGHKRGKVWSWPRTSKESRDLLPSKCSYKEQKWRQLKRSLHCQWTNTFELLKLFYIIIQKHMALCFTSYHTMLLSYWTKSTYRICEIHYSFRN